MRITNKVMQNNSLRHINNNKNLQDTLNTQLSTGKKVDKPSDDPVVAIRALRLRSDVSQIDQYYKKNIEDAKSWLELTESSVKQTVTALTSMITQCEAGASDQYTVQNKLVMIDSLKELKDEVYNIGNADYAGRYIFTGYRTNTSLTFGKEVKDQEYTITEAFDFDDLEKMSFVDTDNLSSITKANYDQATSTAVTEQKISSMDYYRFRLGYDGLDTAQSSLTIQSLPPASATSITMTVAADAETAYKDSINNPGNCYIVPQTGEIVMGADVYDQINNTLNPDGTKAKFTLSYDKTEWKNTDLRPEHYYHCTTQDATGKNIEYNAEYLDKGEWDQPIKYQIGFDQNIQVNSYASDIFVTDVGRDVDEITDLAEKLSDVLEKYDMLKEMSKDTVTYSDAQLDTIKGELAAADKAKTYLTDQLQKIFSKYITKMQGYLDLANRAVAEIGNRGAQVDLVANRLSDQQTTFKELQSNNEDADATEVAVQLSSAQVSYEAALMATSKMISTTLLNYL
ncbi:MAG: flagellar hook-associated protein FlgL [Lachnospiraceae bacterium]|nr:flagellar hook-associated protein FlgL [Lachnospiraceae bacterium]